MLNRRLRSVIATFGNKERGQSAAEFVVVVPFLFLIFFLIVDFGWLFKNWIVVTNAASETARCAAVANCYLTEPDGTTMQVTPEDFARCLIANGIGSDIDGSAIQVTYLDVNGDDEITQGDSVSVAITAPNKFISPVIPLLSVVTGGRAGLSDPIDLYATNEFRMEQPPDDQSHPTPLCAS
jgi:TadE-like protein